MDMHGAAVHRIGCRARERCQMRGKSLLNADNVVSGQFPASSAGSRHSHTSHENSNWTLSAIETTPECRSIVHISYGCPLVIIQYSNSNRALNKVVRSERGHIIVGAAIDF